MPFLLASLLLAALVMFLFGGTELDRGLLILLGGNASPAWNQAAAVATILSSLPMLVAAGGATAGYLLVRRAWRRALLVAVTLAGLVLVEALGAWTLAMRPGVGDRILATQRPVFPDPYAAGGALAWIAIAFSVTRRAPWRNLALGVAVALAVSAGIARILLGIAWPSDVIGGWALGLFWTLLLLWLAGEDLGDGDARPTRPAPASPGPARPAPASPAPAAVTASGIPRSHYSPASPPPVP